MKRLQWLGSTFVVGMLAMVSASGCSDGTNETTASTGSSSGQTPWVPVKIVINEMHAMTEDWVEISNEDTIEGDLSGVGLTDKATDGTPELTNAFRFPAGTKLAPGAYLIVVANLKTPASGPQTMCLMSGGPSVCYQAAWGISNANGDRIYLLSPSDEVVDVATYPMNVVMATQSYCRLPDGSGNFQACTPTPGAVNAM